MTTYAWAAALCTVAAAAVVAGGLTLAVPGTAQASRADCESGANGFVDIAEYQEGAEKHRLELRPGALRPGTLTLDVANIQGRQRGFAKLVAGQSGDEFWLDWTTNYSNGNASSWVQCGPFVSPDSGPHTTAAKETNSADSWRFRACGSSVYSDTVKCTPW
ncbi:hypothetical protein ACIF8T_36600 [Streptomyces sp. NPDC085946]|uniref:hypothetical protein n=1 Tax=Streptomyces sp. NPDC085946 TaxID=3365744 RepID=UPI0037CD3785